MRQRLNAGSLNCKNWFHGWPTVLTQWQFREALGDRVHPTFQTAGGMLSTVSLTGVKSSIKEVPSETGAHTYFLHTLRLNFVQEIYPHCMQHLML